METSRELPEIPEILTYRKPKYVVKIKRMTIKPPHDSHNYHDENHDEIELYKGNNKCS